MRKVDLLAAKSSPFESILQHSTGAGNCSFALMKVYDRDVKLAARLCHMTVEEFKRFAAFIVAIHDIGKIHPAFQFNISKSILGDYAKELKEYGFNTYYLKDFRHELYAEAVLSRILEKKFGLRPRRNRLLRSICRVVTLHHPTKRGESISELASDCVLPYEEAQEELFDVLSKEYGFDGFPEQCDNFSVVFAFLEALIMLSDNIASAFGYDADFDAVIDMMGIGKNMIPEKHSMHDLFPFISDDTMRPLQKAASAINGKYRMIIIEDICGAGKTETAAVLSFMLAKKYDLNGFYYALPAATLCNQMFDRLREMYEGIDAGASKKLRLTHGTAAAHMSASQTAIDAESRTEYGADFLKPSRLALLSPAAVGTIDQIMMSVLKMQYASLRLLGLTSKVVVLDEVHAYDTYMSSINEEMVSWCNAFDVPTVILSATLPTEKKRAYLSAAGANLPEKLSDAYPLITLVDYDGNVSEISVDAFKHQSFSYEIAPFLNKLEKTADLAVEEANKGGCIAVFCNTVRDAQSLYGKIKDRFDGPVILFHSRFTMDDRAEIERKVVSLFGKGAVANGTRPEKAIVICTQVAEQSLDVDFDLIISQLCPIDLLIQRLGREFRFKLNRSPEFRKACFILLTGDVSKSGTGYVYAPYVLKMTENFLKERRTFATPNDVRKAVDYVYSDTDIVTANIQNLADERAEFLLGETFQKNTADMAMIPQPDPKKYFKVEGLDPLSSLSLTDDDPEISTRLGQDTVRVILATEDDIKKYEQNIHDKTLADELLGKSVPLRLKNLSYHAIDSGLLKGYVFAVLAGNVLNPSENEFVVHETGEKVVYSSTGASLT